MPGRRNSESALRSRRGCSPFGEAELEGFRARLAADQDEAARSLDGLSQAGLRSIEDGSTVPTDAAELTSQTSDQALSLDGMARAQVELDQIREALERIDIGK